MNVISQAKQGERPAEALPGTPVALGVIAGYALATGLEFLGAGAAVFGIVLYVVGSIAFGGLIVVQPNQAQVLVLFGRYIGTVTRPGFWCCNPFAKHRTISLRARSFQSERIKVNDAAGNPIEIGAVVVWRVTDTAKAVFDVDDYERFVTVQSETALRELAGRYSYDGGGDGQESNSLRSGAGEVSQALQTELQTRLDIAGIEVLDTGLTHLAYAPEIAGLMLRRQQAEAVLAARRTLVQGVTRMVQTAVGQLADSELIELDPERKAAMVSNLMVTLSGDRTPIPVITTGSLYT